MGLKPTHLPETSRRLKRQHQHRHSIPSSHRQTHLTPHLAHENISFRRQRYSNRSSPRTTRLTGAAVKSILRYLKSSMDYDITFDRQATQQLQLEGHSGLDYGEHRRPKVHFRQHLPPVWWPGPSLVLQEAIHRRYVLHQGQNISRPLRPPRKPSGFAPSSPRARLPPRRVPRPFGGQPELHQALPEPGLSPRTVAFRHPRTLIAAPPAAKSPSSTGTRRTCLADFLTKATAKPQFERLRTLAGICPQSVVVEIGGNISQMNSPLARNHQPGEFNLG